MSTLEEAVAPADTVATVPSPSADLQRARRITRSRNYFLFVLFAGPNIALILAFIYYPLLANMYFSTLDWRLGAQTASFVGLENYGEFFTSRDGLEVWRVTIIFTVATVVGSMVLGLLMALVLNRKLPGRTAARTALFSPYVLSGVGVGLVWTFIFDPRIGILSHFIAMFGGTSPEWFLDKNLALVMVIAVYIWKNLGYCAVIYLAGLQSVPQDLLEAAAIDGAGPVRRFFNVTLPLLSPTVFFLSIAMVLSSMQAFDILRIMTPTGNGTNTIVFEIYLQSFGTYQRAGYAAAISVVLFVTLFLITAIQMRYVERRVHYA
jgi:sn-glycerol 3-phosphate transport system permease protein